MSTDGSVRGCLWMRWVVPFGNFWPGDVTQEPTGLAVQYQGAGLARPATAEEVKAARRASRATSACAASSDLEPTSAPLAAPDATCGRVALEAVST